MSRIQWGETDTSTCTLCLKVEKKKTELQEHHMANDHKLGIYTQEYYSHGSILKYL